MDEEIQSLGQAHPAECRRVRGVLKQYIELGDVGKVGAAVIEAALQRADQAQADQDVIAMVLSYQELKEIH